MEEFSTIIRKLFYFIIAMHMTDSCKKINTCFRLIIYVVPIEAAINFYFVGGWKDGKSEHKYVLRLNFLLDHLQILWLCMHKNLVFFRAANTDRQKWPRLNGELNYYSCSWCVEMWLCICVKEKMHFINRKNTFLLSLWACEQRFSKICLFHFVRISRRIKLQEVWYARSWISYI